MSTYDKIVAEFLYVEEQIMTTCKAFIADAAETVEIEAVQDSPAPGDIHPYATGNYRDSWGRQQIDELTWSVNNNASRKGREYAVYTDGGYTRQGGPGTARSFLLRQPPGSYSNLTEQRLVLRLEVDLQRRLDLIKGDPHGR